VTAEERRHLVADAGHCVDRKEEVAHRIAADGVRFADYYG
jgi:hypothetical protein